MNPVLICYKPGNDAARHLALKIAVVLESGKNPVRLLEAGQTMDFLPGRAIVVGGDGTILGVARKLAGKQVPILGINLGRVGYLAAVEPADWSAAMAKFLSGRMPVAKCIALRFEHMRNGEIVHTGTAVNDIVAARGRMARLVNFEVGVDGMSAGMIRCDGIILGTPLGSTGYSASAGGSILPHCLELLNFVPVCPFPGRVSPMIFAGTSEVVMALGEESRECFITIDGQEVFPLEYGEELHVKGLPGAVWLAGCRKKFRQIF